MLFNSYIFILAFLPITIIGYFGLNRLGRTEAAKVFLLGMSFWFYGYFRLSYLAILVMSIVVNYLLFLIFTKKDPSGKKRNAVLIAGLVINIGTLGFFKYLDFIFESINFVFGADIPLTGILLPLGISFFTFQQIGFIVDAYRGETENYKFIDYALFVSFFPQLVAGPIVTHAELIPQLKDPERKRIKADNFAAGLTSFILGLSKKILLADVFAKAVDYAWNTVELLSPIDTALAVLSFYLQIYFDFSGYSDMAIGLGKMLNLDLPMNFDSPYKSVTIREYWKRWHMTLTAFLTKYLYIPLGGSRKGKVRTYLNVMIVFLVSGIWHGAGTGYIFWGLFHGAGMVFCRIFEKPLKWMESHKITKALLWIFNTAYVAVLFSIFRGESLGKGIEFLKHLIPAAGHSSFALPQSFLLPMFQTYELNYALKLLHVPVNEYGGLILCIGYIVVAMAIILFAPNVRQITAKVKEKPRAVFAIPVALALVWSFVSLSGISTYIYYNF